MPNLIFLGTDLHNNPTELASKIVTSLKPSFPQSTILSIQNRKPLTNQDITTIPKLTENQKLRKLFQALALPLYLTTLRLKGHNKIASFWTVSSSYHSLLFKYLKLIRFQIYFTIISGYDKNYSSLKHVDTIICQSKRMFDYIKKQFPEKHTILIHPGVDLNTFKPSKKSDTIIIPSIPYKVSLFHERQTQKILTFLKLSPNTKARIITRSNESANYIRSLLPRAEIINRPLSDKELSAILSKAKLVPLLYKEGPDMPLSAIESLASGCAIICTDIMGLADIIRENNCGAVLPKDSTLNKQLIDQIFNSPSYQNNARKTAEKLFPLNSTIRNYKKLLNF